MDGNCYYALLPQELRMSAKRSLVKITANDDEVQVKSSKLMLNPSYKEGFKPKKLKSSLFVVNSTNNHSVIKYSVLPSNVRLKKQRIIRVPSQDDLWKSIKSNYLFLMDNNLIKECQKTRKELSLCSPPSSPIPQQPISFPEFIERFNALHDRLHLLLLSQQDSTKQQNFIKFQSEMDLLGGEYSFLCDQAVILQRLDPELKIDVGRRCTILKNKWNVLVGSLWPKKKQEQDKMTKSLTTEIRVIRKWLREVDDKLRRLKVTNASSPEEIANICNEEKVLQREIEERGKEINSLVRRCKVTKDGATTAHHPARLCRYAAHLERSWHHIWIRSLENQCLTEQHLLRHSPVITQNLKDSSDIDSDEGPLRKHRRLTLDHWTALASTMDKLKKEQAKRTGDIVKNSQRTRDIGILCREKVPVNDKCIMVGTTGIAALKAEYGDDFTNFEIIQDVGYSSESSTHLSGDDTGLDNHFNVRIYQYTKDNQPTPLSLREELETAVCLRNFHCLGSSLESSSSAAASLDDSGLGNGETLTTGDSSDVLGQFRVDDEYEQEELDYLETVLDECVDFGANIASDPEELHFNLSGLDSDDPSDNFQNRSSFTTSAQVFYKMISVDSDNGDADNNGNDSNNNISSLTATSDSPADISTLANNDISAIGPTIEDHLNSNTKFTSSDSDPETFKPVQCSSNYNEKVERPQRSHRALCSTPVQKSDLSRRHQGVKRKRGYENVDPTRMSNRVRSWLNRCSDFSTPRRHRKSSSHSPADVAQSLLAEGVSSCDASCEGTSSSADEGNMYSSMFSFCEDDDVFRLKPRLDSGDGSVETVVHALLDSEFPFLLPPPPSSTASFGSGSKNCSTICYRVKKRGRRLKASSDGDVEKQRNLKEISNLPTHNMLQKQSLSKTAGGSGHRQYSSLPCFLRPTSDSSTDDNWVSSTLPSHSDTKTVAYPNHSSSSEVGRRRRRRSRKKSSSSNRSSTSVLLSSGDHSRHRSRTITSSTSRCGSRRRHTSQRSDFFCSDVLSSDEGKSPLKVEIPPVTENVGFEDLRRASSTLLSPVESDIVLTHLEEQSTVSDQVWDGYQEMPYLSEGYSEATVDEDAVRKLTEFGDDYGSAIGQPLRLMEASRGSDMEGLKPPKKPLKTIPINQRLPSLSDDSDSDSEDLHYVIEEAGKALHFAKAILKKKETGDYLTTAHYAELLATCGTHLRCLETIRKLIDGKEHNFSVSDLKQLHYLIEEWQELQRTTEMYEKSEDPAQLKYLKAQENIDALYNKMSQLSSHSCLDTSSISSWEDVEKNMSRLQMVLTSLQEAKNQLLTVNLQVHRFTTEYGNDDEYKDSSLKNDVTELYRLWEDTYEINGTQLTELKNLKTDWEIYNEKYRNLRLLVKETELENDCDNTCLISTAKESGSLRKSFEELKEYSALLESRLKGGDAWKKIEEELRDLQRRIDKQDRSPLRTASRSVNHRSPSSRIEEDADDHFEDAIQQLCDDKDHSSLSTPHKKDAGTSKAPRRNRGRFWKIVRIAVPVQVALVLLYCLACYLEPSCCNALNNFNFSFTPQLRYYGVRPPV